jgi:hypothetical protein
MGSLIASHLVTALINAALGGVWGYVAAIEPAASAVPAEAYVAAIEPAASIPVPAEAYVAAIEPAASIPVPAEAYVAAIAPAAPIAVAAEAHESRSAQFLLLSTAPLFATRSALRSLTLDETRIRSFARDSTAAAMQPSGAFVPSAPVTRPLIGNAVHLEMPRMAPDGKFVRPKIVVGLASSELKSWLRTHGIAAEQCLLPMLRARARLDQQTNEFSAGLTVYARCTFY